MAEHACQKSACPSDNACKHCHALLIYSLGQHAAGAGMHSNAMCISAVAMKPSASGPPAAHALPAPRAQPSAALLPTRPLAPPPRLRHPLQQMLRRTPPHCQPGQAQSPPRRRLQRSLNPEPAAGRAARARPWGARGRRRRAPPAPGWALRRSRAAAARPLRWACRAPLRSPPRAACAHGVKGVMRAMAPLRCRPPEICARRALDSSYVLPRRSCSH